MSELEALPQKKMDYFSFLILLIITWFIADQIVYLLTIIVPALFVPLTDILDQLVIPLFLTLFALIIGRLLTHLFPALNVDELPSWIIVFLPVLILIHPILINVSGTDLIINWSLLGRIEAGGFLSWILETIVLMFGAFGIALISVRQEKKFTGPLGRYIKYLAKDIFSISILLLIIFYLIRSFILEQFEGIDLSLAVKLVLIYLLVIGMEPIAEES